MRSFGLWVTILIGLVVTAGVLIYLEFGSFAARLESREPEPADRQVSPSEPRPPSTSAVPPSSAQTSPAPVEGRAGSGTKPGRAAAGALVSSGAPLTGAAAAQVKIRRFPRAGDVPAGTNSEQLLDAFIPPTLRINTLRKGDLIEVFVYVAEDNNAITYVNLRNGRVVGVHSGIY